MRLASVEKGKKRGRASRLKKVTTEGKGMFLSERKKNSFKKTCGL